MQLQWIEGGVCAPKGFVANAMLAGIKANSKKDDTALIFSDTVPSSFSSHPFFLPSVKIL